MAGHMQGIQKRRGLNGASMRALGCSQQLEILQEPFTHRNPRASVLSAN
jgi:hypothetical protein